MRLQGALIKEQGVTFAVVIVKRHIVNCATQAAKTIENLDRFFPGNPIVLMAQDSRGKATYRGRRDIVKFLSRIPLSRIPWKEFTFR